MSSFKEGYDKLTEEQRNMLEKGEDYRGNLYGRGNHKHNFIGGRFGPIHDHLFKEHQMGLSDPRRASAAVEHLAASVAEYSWKQIFSMEDLDKVAPEPTTGLVV